jgi:cell division protein FtsI (penicillin-binding protein 3)
VLSKKNKIKILTVIFLSLMILFFYKKMYTYLFADILFYIFIFYLVKKDNKKYKTSNFTNRSKILSRICIFLIMILTIRLFKIQVVDHRIYEDMSMEQIEATYSVVGNRGKIMDFGGKPLAYNSNIYNIAIDPRRVYNVDLAMEALEDIDKNYININYKQLKNEIPSLAKDNRKYKIIAKDVPEEIKDKIEERINKIYKLKKNEIFFKKKSNREYYRKDIFAHLIGFTGYTKKSEDTKIGNFGVEKKYDEYLKSRKVTKKDIFTRSRFMKLPTASDEIEISANGENIYLTVDYFLQYILSEEVKKQFDKTKAQMGLGLIMDPNNGKILATSIFNREKQKNLRNEIIQSQYEPGSTFKPIIVASALEEGIVTPDETFDIGDGKIVRYRHTIRESSRHTKGILSTKDVLKKSSNVGMVLISDKFEDSVFEKYLINFGLEDRTQIDLPGELKPYMQNYKKWNGLKKNNMAFGQGIAITPIQLATAFSSIINGGILYRPYVVDRIAGDDGIVMRRNTPHPVRRTISPKVSQEMREILEEVVADGTGKNAYIDGYRIGGKTGTAQISTRGGYIRGEYLSSFIGFFPANKPQYVMLFMFLKPQADVYYNKFGGAVAAPVFKEVAKKIIKHKNILPGNIEYLQESEVKLPEDIAGEDVLTEMPDLKGKGAREVLKLMGKLNLEVEVSGTGLVQSQWPKKGTSLEKINKVRVYLK